MTTIAGARDPERGETTGAVIIEARGLERAFAARASILARLAGTSPPPPLTAVRGVDLAIRRGETFALVGESGSGKTTIARMLVGLLRPTAGQVVIDGRDLWGASDAASRRALRSRLQLIFQNPYASLNPRWRVGAIVAEPIRARGRAPDANVVGARVAELLAEVGLAATDAARFPHEFSGGERQRIAIARALAAAPDILVADEPTSSLDVSVQAQILNLLRRLKAERGLTTVLISHDLAVVRHMADRIGVLYLGRLVECGPTAELLARPRHPYTRMLLDAAPDPTARRAPHPIIGEPPSPTSPPPGCSFHPRCARAIGRCAIAAPALVAHGAAAVACHVVDMDAAAQWDA